MPPTLTIQSPIASGSITIFSGTTLLFEASGSDQDYNGTRSVKFYWKIDGSIKKTYYNRYSSTFSYTFNLPDNVNEKSHLMTVTVRDNEGNYRSKSITVNVIKSEERHYYLTDHLGSVRTTVSAEAIAPTTPEEEDVRVSGWDDYYAFGLAMPGRSSNSGNPNDNYKFTGHEFDNEANLNLYHMVTRGYDPVLGRFNSIDAHYFYYPHLSSYSYVGNNPISYWDPFGMDFFRSEDGAVLWADTDDEEYLKDGATYTNIGTTFLSFDGEFLTVHNQVEDKKGNRSVETSMFEAKSGLPNEAGKFDYSLSRQKEKNRGPVPEGLWQLTGQRYHTTDPDVLPSAGYYDTKGRGWYMKLKSVTAPTHGRTGFEIHPDGNVPGTAGCIGISCQVPNLPQQFYDAMEKTLQGVAKDKLPMINIKYKKSEN